ncbi:hypothetical protein, partial [Paenibacillus peoriae]|uniref:hypothetical protein n=1 Tax=Paenibacillus peoriae TaxID=59893 RepID=UPI00097ABE66
MIIISQFGQLSKAFFYDIGKLAAKGIIWTLTGYYVQRTMHKGGLPPVCETGIKTPFKFKQPVVGNLPA